MLLAALQDRGDEVRLTDAALMEQQLADRKESALGQRHPEAVELLRKLVQAASLS